MIHQGKGPPPLEPIHRVSPNDEIVAAAKALEPGGWFWVPVPEQVKENPVLLKRRVNALASLIARRVRPYVDFRVVVSKRAKSLDLIVRRVS